MKPFNIRSLFIFILLILSAALYFYSEAKYAVLLLVVLLLLIFGAIITAIILFAFFLVQLIPGFTTSAKPVEPPSPRYVLHSPSEMPPMRG